MPSGWRNLAMRRSPATCTARRSFMTISLRSGACWSRCRKIRFAHARVPRVASRHCARAEVDSGRIGAIGFCFGGTVALELARSGADVRGVVGFHSGLATARPQDARNIKGKVLVCLGADDPGIPPEQRADFEREMRDGGVAWRMHLYEIGRAHV